MSFKVYVVRAEGIDDARSETIKAIFASKENASKEATRLLVDFLEKEVGDTGGMAETAIKAEARRYGVTAHVKAFSLKN